MIEAMRHLQLGRLSLLVQRHPEVADDVEVVLKEVPVDENQVQLPHFGIILTPNEFQDLSKRLTDKVTFIIEPYTRFKGTAGEQSTLFFLDPNGYALEFKAFEDDQYIFTPFTS